MSDQDVLTDDQVAELEASGEAYYTDDDIAKMDAADRFAAKATNALGGVGGAITKGVATASRVADSVLLGPLRAAVGAAIEGKDPYTTAQKQFLNLNDTPPTGDDLLGKMGVPSGPEIETPLVLSPTGERLKVTPRAAAGGVLQAVTDPFMYAPGVASLKAAGAGIGAAKKLSPKVAAYLQQKAAERAVKAGTGQNIKALRKIGKVNPQSAPDIDVLTKNLTEAGTRMLRPDEAGAPVVGWLSNAENVAEKAAAKRKYYGGEIGSVGKRVDEVLPAKIPEAGASGPGVGGAVATADLISDLQRYRDSIPNVGKGAQVRNSLSREMENLQGMGDVVSFAKAQEIKNQFPFEPAAADALISSKDASNRIRGIVGERMDESVGKAATQSQDPALLERYQKAKGSYGLYKDLAQAGTDRAAKNVSNRFVSPSDYGVGAAASVGEMARGGTDLAAMIKGALVGAANKQLRERGSAFSARGLDKLSRIAEEAPQSLGKYEGLIRKAAAAGPAALVTRHHVLMNNDPEYRQIIEGTP